MDVKLCSAGHYYDSSEYSECPVCAKKKGVEVEFGSEDMDSAVPPTVGGPSVSFEDGGKMDGYSPTQPGSATMPGDPVTVGKNPEIDVYGETEPVGINSAQLETMPPGSNVSMGGYGSTYGATFSESGVTMPANVNNVAGFSPVTGWLVCVEGPMRGKDYRIKPGYNYIGRAANMQIYIEGDQTISRERHAVIAYDNKGKVFFFGPMEGQSTVYINDALVINKEILKPYDIITIGNTKFVFVPLCGDNFTW